jgi:lysophospholipase L1-like esterase
MNAADGLHPSDEGYVLWYRTLMHQAPLGATQRTQ